MSYAIFRMQKVHIGNIGNLEIHNERKTENHSNKDINVELSKNNIQLIECNSYKKALQKNIDNYYKSDRNIRKDAVVAVETIFTSDYDFFINKTDKEKELFFEKSLEFLKEFVGEKNIIAATIHYDETTPHMHCVFTPIDEQGKLKYKSFVSHKNDLIKLQDKYFEKMSLYFPELERGKSAKETQRKNLSVEEFKEKTNLEKEILELEKNIENKKNELEEYKDFSNHLQNIVENKKEIVQELSEKAQEILEKIEEDNYQNDRLYSIYEDIQDDDYSDEFLSAIKELENEDIVHFFEKEIFYNDIYVGEEIYQQYRTMDCITIYEEVANYHNFKDINKKMENFEELKENYESLEKKNLVLEETIKINQKKLENQEKNYKKNSELERELERNIEILKQEEDKKNSTLESIKRDIKEFEEFKIIAKPNPVDLRKINNFKKNISNLDKFFPFNEIQGLKKFIYTNEIKLEKEQILTVKNIIKNLYDEVVVSEKIVEENLELKETVKKYENTISRQQNKIIENNTDLYELREKNLQLETEINNTNKIFDVLYEKAPALKEAFEEVKKELFPEKTNHWKNKLKKEKSKDRGMER